MNNPNSSRVERDSMGSIDVPHSAYYGASTMRAVSNFPISSLRFSRDFIQALSMIKGAAAKTNSGLGLLDNSLATAIQTAAREVASGQFDDEFVVDVFQTGSGTSTNMNANEVIANRASEHMGGSLGSRHVHPNDHVNMCQSSNDVIPSAIHVAALIGMHKQLLPALVTLEGSLSDKIGEFWGVIKTGRTHLQDATPIRLGQEFTGYADQITRAQRRVEYAMEGLSEIALGGTAVGTGVNAHPEFARLVCAELTEQIGHSVRESSSHFQAQSAIDSIVEASGILRTVAVSLNKIANDIRWLGSGPRAGIGEISLPIVQPGSSIMPGKVNPVIAESVIQACAQVIGNDLAVCQAGLGSYFELNLMLPVAAHNLLQSIEILGASARNFAGQCVDGLKATAVGPEMIESGLMLGTALAPAIGYDKAAEIAKEAANSGSTIREVAGRLTSLSSDDLSTLLDAEKMTEPGLGGGPSSG